LKQAVAALPSARAQPSAGVLTHPRSWTGDEEVLQES
jgi:hypothetical protein